MAPATLLLVALIAGRRGIARSLPIIGLYLPDNFGLEAEWLGLIQIYGIHDIHDNPLIDRFAH